MTIFPFTEIQNTCCFTGPRPEKIYEDIQDIQPMLKDTIIDAYHNGYRNFISGMSRGFDLIAAQCVLELQNSYDIHLISVIPFLNQDSFWSTQDQILYNDILSQARYTYCVSESFHRGAYYERNRAMVNNSSLVITYYYNTGGGTKYTIDYAKKFDTKILNIFNTQLSF